MCTHEISRSTISIQNIFVFVAVQEALREGKCAVREPRRPRHCLLVVAAQTASHVAAQGDVYFEQGHGQKVRPTRCFRTRDTHPTAITEGLIFLHQAAAEERGFCQSRVG
jgi:hypothetical protein